MVLQMNMLIISPVCAGQMFSEARLEPCFTPPAEVFLPGLSAMVSDAEGVGGVDHWLQHWLHCESWASASHLKTLFSSYEK